MVFSSSARTINHIFYRINLLNKSSPLNWVSKKPTWRENGYSQKRVRSPLLEECKLWPWKQRAELFVSMSSKLAWFLHKLYINRFVHSRLSTNQVIFKCYFKNPCFQPPQKLPWTDEMMRVISARSSVIYNYYVLLCVSHNYNYFSWGITLKWRKQTADPAPAPEKP